LLRSIRYEKDLDGFYGDFLPAMDGGLDYRLRAARRRAPGNLGKGRSPLEKAAMPSAEPGAGEVDSDTELTLSTATVGAAVYYTLDGTGPDSTKTRYEKPIPITAALTLKAVAVKEGMENSPVLEAAYTVAAPGTAARPWASPEPGEVAAGTEITLSTTTDEADIYYTLDGTWPDQTSTKYTWPIRIDDGLTIKAIAVKPGLTHSSVLEGVYTIAVIAPETPETPDAPNTPDWTETPSAGEEVPPKINGIEIRAYPNITYFARNQPFTYEGLELVFVYDNGDRGRKLNPGEYTVETISTAKALSRRVTVTSDTTEGRFTVKYGITIDSSTSVLGNIRMEQGPSKRDYLLGEEFNTAGMVVKGTYQGGDRDGEEKTLDPGAVTAEGYVKYHRGTQQVTFKLNNAVLGTVEATVKVPAEAVITVNQPMESFTWAQKNHYKPVRVKGEAFDLGRSNLKATVKVGSASFTLTYENGGITEADLSGYNPSVAGLQTLTLTLDGNTAAFLLYIADAEPEAWFDYGWWRHDQDPRGAGPGEGVYYAKPNETLVLAPVRFLIGYDADNHDIGASYSWSVSGPSGYTHTLSSTGEFCSFTPREAGTWTVAVEVTGRNYVNGGTITKRAVTEVVCYTGTIPAPAGKSYRPPVKNFGPGQFVSGGTGLGWSLGSALGYEVWSLPGGAADLKIYGNPFWPWSEAGIVWVQYDANGNGNGFPDETWYELKGGEDDDAFNRTLITRRYAINQFRGQDVTDPNGRILATVYWVDSKGRGGGQYGWPSAFGLSDALNTRVTYTGTLLRDTGDISTGGYGNLAHVGYVDTASGSTKFPIGKFNVARDAIRADGSPANLDPTLVRFVKVQTAIFVYGGSFGDVSTEIVSGTNLSDQSGGFPMPWE
jgi:hypothetical protein